MKERKGSFPRHISSFFKGCVWYSLWEDFNTPDPHLAPAPLVTPIELPSGHLALVC